MPVLQLPAGQLLRVGSSGAAITTLQQQLTDLGFNPGAISGTFTLQTKSAVIAFQNSRPLLVADGVVGLVTAASLNDASLDLDGQQKLKDISANNKIISLADFKKDTVLVRWIQKKLKALGLYPGGQFIDGLWGPTTEAGIISFCEATNLNTMASSAIQFDNAFADALNNTQQLPSVLQQGKDSASILNKLSDYNKRWIARFRNQFPYAALAYLDRGVEHSPYHAEIQHYTQRLEQIIDNSLIDASPLSNFSVYPELGKKPDILEGSSLDFLGENITEACICLGSFSVGNPEVRVRWLGKNALKNTQCLSATKFLPVLSVVCQANEPPNGTLNVCECNIREAGSGTGENFQTLVTDMVSYRRGVSHSNALGLMFKLFKRPGDLEAWIAKTVTGNISATGNIAPGFSFNSIYGVPPAINRPELIAPSKTFILKSKATEVDYPGESGGGKNAVSVYDLCRLISMVGWHHHLPNKHLLHANWESLSGVVTAMGTDSARYIDVALETLGLENVITSPVIISKLGYGNSALVYVAFVQFVDEHLKEQGQPAKLRSIAMALRAAKNNQTDTEAVRVDAGMAAAVTEILRRVVTEELA
jgi:peptidoglycan hydrolase-like protein with peptidoglycan-binding domain